MNKRQQHEGGTQTPKNLSIKLEMLLVRKKLAFQLEENNKLNAELLTIKEELSGVKGSQKEYAKGLKKIMFMISHQVRQPIAHIIGISHLLELAIKPAQNIKRLIAYIRQSAQSLNIFTKELTSYIHKLERKATVPDPDIVCPKKQQVDQGESAPVESML